MSRWIQDQSWKRGQGVEAMFAKLLNERTTNVREANMQEQFSHVDYLSDFGKIDVKARKRIARSDNNTQDDLVWLEFKNVQGKKAKKPRVLLKMRCKIHTSQIL